MILHLYKVRALVAKDVKDVLKNGNMLLLSLLPILFTALYSSMDFGGEKMPSDYVLTMGLLMNLCMVPISAMSMIIAEEKEKNTLRTLMLSNVSAAEFLLSKATVIFLLTQVSNLIIYFITGPESVGIGLFLVVTCLGSLCMMFFGALIGIVSKNQMSTGMLSAPVMLIMLLPAIFAMLNESIEKFARFTPSYALIQLLASPPDAAFYIAVIAVWTLIVGLLFALVYRKKRLD